MEKTTQLKEIQLGRFLSIIVRLAHIKNVKLNYNVTVIGFYSELCDNASKRCVVS